MTGPASPSAATPDQIASARELSAALKDFHKTLIQAETGSDPALDNPYSKLFALINDPNFAWLGVLLRLAARIDQHVADGEIGKPGLLAALHAEVENLLAGTGSEAASEFRMRHMMALQREPDVGLATGRLRRALAAKA